MNTASLQTLRERPHWSFSQINGLANYCSLKWAFHYVYGAEPEFTPMALIFGGVFHQVLSFACGRRAAGRDVTAAECNDAFASLFSDRVKESEPKVKFNEGDTTDILVTQARQMIEVWLDKIDPEEEVLSIGMPFSVPLSGLNGMRSDRPLIGEFDLVVRSNNRLTIVDWKTSARKWPAGQADNDLQPTCYCYAHWKSTGELPAFRFDVVTKTKTPAVVGYPTERTLDDTRRLIGIVQVLERMIRAECFFPHDGSWECSGCPYGSECKSWHARKTCRHFTLKAAA